MIRAPRIEKAYAAPPALAALLILFSGCAEAPVSLKYEARAAIETAREHQAGVYAPELVSLAEAAYTAGVGAMSIQAARWTPGRDYTVARARLETALRRARLSQEVSAGRRRELELRTDALLTTAHGSLENLRFILTYLSPRSHIRSDLTRSRILYEEAKSLRRGGELRLAQKRAEEASAQLASLSETLARVIDTYTNSGREAHYRRWVRETVQNSINGGSTAILVDKLRHTLTVLRAGRIIRTYRAELGLNGVQDKTMAGDKATPEGMYRIVEKRGPGQTRWYKALLINYPNDLDREQFDDARRRGLISRRAKIGGLIEVHGEGGRQQDWTEGCVALDNQDIDDLYDLVSVGTPITIVGYEGENWFDTREPDRRRSVAAGETSSRKTQRRRGKR